MILYIDRHIGYETGVAQSSRDVIRGLQQSGFSVRLITNRGPEEKPDGDLQVLEPPYSMRNGTHRTPGLLRGFKRLVERKWFYQKALQNKPELTVVNSLANHDYFLELSLPNNDIKVIIVRESPGHFTLRNDNSIRYAEEALTVYDYLIFVSERCRKVWCKRVPEINERSWYLPNTSDEQKLSRWKEASRETVRVKNGWNEGYHIICPGNVSYRKGQDTLLEAWPDIKDKIPEATLHFVGTIKSDWANNLQRQYTSEDIIFHGPRRDLPGLLYAADLCIVPSRAEAMPRVILEAMYLETPIVATDADGNPEMIDHDKTGVLVDKEEPGELSKVVIYLNRQEDKAREYANNGFLKYQNQFTQSLYQKRLKRIFDELAGISV